MKKRSKISFGSASGGFSLLECVFAIFIITIGLLAIAALAVAATKTETFSYNSVEASTLATSKMEELKAGTLTNGGSLTSNVTGYFDAPDFKYYRRWQISSGPSGTREVSVAIVSQGDATQMRTTRISTLVR